MSPGLRSSAAGRPGPSHAESEDAFLADDTRGAWAVSDGLGARAGAGVASRTIVETLARALETRPSAGVRRWLSAAVQEAGRAVERAAAGNRRWRDMSATLTLLVAGGPEAFLAHVGDSRAYRVRDGSIEQLTRDHSVAWEQFAAGAITKADLRRHPNQKLLTRTIDARRGFVIADLTAIEIRPGDVHVLASDGLTKALDDAEILSVARATPLEGLAAALVEAAIRAGADDDVTVVAVG